MNLTGKQKRVLRSLAQTKKSVFQIGKEGLTNQIVLNVYDYLNKNELGKISILDTCSLAFEEIEALLLASNITVVQKIGKVLVLYMPNPNLDVQIELPL